MENEKTPLFIEKCRWRRTAEKHTLSTLFWTRGHSQSCGEWPPPPPPRETDIMQGHSSHYIVENIFFLWGASRLFYFCFPHIMRWYSYILNIVTFVMKNRGLHVLHSFWGYFQMLGSIKLLNSPQPPCVSYTISLHSTLQFNSLHKLVPLYKPSMYKLRSSFRGQNCNHNNIVNKNFFFLPCERGLSKPFEVNKCTLASFTSDKVQKHCHWFMSWQVLCVKVHSESNFTRPYFPNRYYSYLASIHIRRKKSWSI